MTSHDRLPYATPTCDSYGRTDGRTNEESYSPTRDTSSSVTHAHTYGFSPIQPGLRATTTPCANRLDVDWHANNIEDRARAAALCVGCPIQLTCAEGALERHETWGVWGGFDFEDITQNAQQRERRWAEGATPRAHPRCGTPSGSNRHYRAGEKPCTACALALNHHRRKKRSAA